MNGVQELAFVQAKVFEVGDQYGYDWLLKWERHLWWFQDSSAEHVWDVIDNPDLSVGQTGVFQSLAVCFTLTPMPNPAADVGPKPMSYLGVATAPGQDTVSGLFEPSDVGALADLTLRLHASSDDQRHVQFIGVFDVVFDWSLDEEGHKVDFTCGVLFLGELNLRRELPLTTSGLEMDILRAMPPGEFWHFGMIAQCFGAIDSWRLRSAVDQLVQDELLMYRGSLTPSRYVLSDKGIQALTR